MLIDASHPEETRVAVVRGNRIEEFDFESQEKKQLRGNIYLAKVTKVEPSLQAAFVDYGGNRHGFMAFSEIHPDYYQIPVADRQALLDAEAEDARASREAEEEEDNNVIEVSSDDDEEDEAPKKKPRRHRSKKAKAAEENSDAEAGTDEAPSENETSDKIAEVEAKDEADGSEMKVEKPNLSCSVYKRCMNLMSPGGDVHCSLKSIKEIIRNKEDHIIIHYKDIVTDPVATVKKIYNYLGLEFKGVRTTNLDQYEIKGIKYRDHLFDLIPHQNLHTLRTDKIDPNVEIDVEKHLPKDIIEMFKNSDVL